jgi:8-oxo-dGTP diphosphatase
MAEAGPMVVVAAAMIDGDRVLLQQRPPGKAMAGLWEFPGGKVEPGETPDHALTRELEEELGVGVDARNVRPITFAVAPLDDRHLLLLLYEVRAWGGQPQALEASALAWMSPAGMSALPMPPADVPLVEALAKLLAR